MVIPGKQKDAWIIEKVQEITLDSITPVKLYYIIRLTIRFTAVAAAWSNTLLDHAQGHKPG